jgi:hypothetical protein
MLNQWLVLRDNRVARRFFLANGTKIFRGDFLQEEPPTLYIEDGEYESDLAKLLGNPSGFDIADYAGINTVLEDVSLNASDPLVYRLNVSAVDPTQPTIYADEAVGTAEETIKFDDGAGNTIFTRLEDDAIIRNSQTGEFMSVLQAPYTVLADEDTDDIDTSIDVDDGANIRGGFVLTNERTDEQLLINTTPAGNTLDVTRGHNSTTALPILTGDVLTSDRVLVSRATYGFPAANAVVADDAFVQTTFTYQWEIREGSPLLTFSDDTSPTPEITIPTGTAGRWLLRVAVSDGYTVVCHDIVVERAESFSVGAGINQLVEQDEVGSTEVQLAGAVSGLSTTLSWMQLGGEPAYFEPHANVADPVVVLPPTGNVFTFRLSATDFFGDSASKTVIITRNVIPAIELPDDPMLASGTTDWIVAGVSISDADNFFSAPTIIWSIVSGPVTGILNLNSLTPTLQFSGDGTAVVKATVSDGVSNRVVNFTVTIG